MKRVLFSTAILLALSTPPALAGACGAPEGWHQLTPEGETGFQAALTTGAKMPKVGEPFDVELKVCSVENQPVDRLSVDATMPAHKHGMNYQPQLSKTGDGDFKATGFLFHMPGAWKITVSVYSAGKPNHLSMDIEVP